MHVLLGPLISAIAEGERMKISSEPGCMFREQQFLGVYDGNTNAHQCEQNLHTADATHPAP